MRRRGYLHFFIVCLYIYCRWRYNHQEERVGISLTGWTPSHVYACSKPEPGFLLLLPVKFIPQCIIEPCHMSWYLLCSVKIRGDCSFFFKLWNWWNWLPSLFKLFFITSYILGTLYSLNLQLKGHHLFIGTWNQRIGLSLFHFSWEAPVRSLSHLDIGRRWR